MAITRWGILTAGNHNYSSTATWSSTANGLTTPASVPDAGVSWGISAICEAGATLTLDSATQACLDMDWTGAGNTPTLAFGTNYLYFYGDATFIAAMVTTGTDGYIIARGAASKLTTNGLVLTCGVSSQAKLTFQDDVTMTNRTLLCNVLNTILDTNGKTVNCGAVALSDASAHTVTLGASVINCTSVVATLCEPLTTTLTANTATINISGTGAFAGGTLTAWNNINLNGTAHIVSGAFTCAILTRNGTATTTDSITFTSGTTYTMTTCAMIGNSVTNRLLVKSSNAGIAATIATTNWTGTDAVNFRDIKATTQVDLSAITNFAKDFGGNTNIIFTATMGGNLLSAVTRRSGIDRLTAITPSGSGYPSALGGI